jgi:hypothetical protein
MEFRKIAQIHPRVATEVTCHLGYKEDPRWSLIEGLLYVPVLELSFGGISEDAFRSAFRLMVAA